MTDHERIEALADLAAAHLCSWARAQEALIYEQSTEDIVGELVRFRAKVEDRRKELAALRGDNEA